MKQLLISDYNQIEKYLNEANYEGYNSNFVTMMMWNHEYNVQYEIHDNFMVMLQVYKNQHHFAMPFCKPEYYHEAINYMMEYAKQYGFEFSMDLVIEPVKDKINELYGSDMLYLYSKSYDDYIYEKSLLETLVGKKMQKRRNHFNAFIKENPDYIYKEIEDEDIDNVLRCLTQWDDSHENEASIQSEFIGIMYLLMHRNSLDIKTGCIYINGKLEAFIIGSRLKHQTIQIHVEKANKDIRGLYVAIGKFFLEKNYPEYLYVNREEDMGIESLRKAKQSLHPIKMIKKYRIELNRLHISKAKDSDKQDIINLWQECFKDEDELSTNFYFNNRYKEDYTYVIKNYDKLIGALQIVPYILDEDRKVFFILGICTKEEYQRNGCMQQLMNYVLNLDTYKDAKIILQAYNPEIYRKFGFNKMYYHNLINVDNTAYDKNTNITEATINSSQALELYKQFCLDFNGYRKRDINYYENYLFKRCEAFNDKIVGVYDNSSLLGYVIYHIDEIKTIISELIYKDNNALQKIVSHFATKENDLIIECDLKTNVIGEKDIICTMMSNTIKEDKIDEILFINELY